MSTYKDAKTMARSLREALAGRNIALSHGECLEMVARQLGCADWNTLAAKLSLEEPRIDRPQSCGAASSAATHVRSCSFCGKSQHHVRSLIEGGCSRPPRVPESCVFICDECVAFCAEVNADRLGPAVPAAHSTA